MAQPEANELFAHVRHAFRVAVEVDDDDVRHAAWSSRGVRIKLIPRSWDGRGFPWLRCEHALHRFAANAEN